MEQIPSIISRIHTSFHRDSAAEKEKEKKHIMIVCVCTFLKPYSNTERLEPTTATNFFVLGSSKYQEPKAKHANIRISFCHSLGDAVAVFEVKFRQEMPPTLRFQFKKCWKYKSKPTRVTKTLAGWDFHFRVFSPHTTPEFCCWLGEREIWTRPYDGIFDKQTVVYIF